MGGLDLSQSEADLLIRMEKIRVDELLRVFPERGDTLALPLRSLDGREHFLMDVSRGAIDVAKVKYQNRARQVTVLVRLDLAGPRHRNPDQEEVPCPHIHLYREGFGDKWAFELPTGLFLCTTDVWATLGDFMRYCNVTKPPHIERGFWA